MTNSVRFARWTVSCDAESTQKAYSAITIGSPEECGCTPCRNFAAQRKDTYPADVLALFEKLGVPPNREAEIYHMARLSSGKHLYGGWFHFVGVIENGKDAVQQVSESVSQPDLESISGGFSMGFTSKTGLVPKSFAGLPVVQLEFTAELPWVLEAGEPQ